MQRSWLSVAAVGLVTLALAGGAAFFAHRSGSSGPDRDAAPGGSRPPSAPPAHVSPGLDAASLVVHDGDLVEASGLVIRPAGKPPRLCAPAPVPAMLPSPGTQPSCAMGVDLAGLDLSALDQDQRARIRGTLRGGVLQVSAQLPAEDRAGAAVDWRVPCAPPPGGWTRGRTDDDNAFHAYVYDEHPEWFAEPRVGYPDGEPTAGPTDGPQPRQVFVVEIVAGDPTAVERDLRAHYKGDICVVRNPGGVSLAGQQRALEQVRAVVEPLMDDPANGIYTMSGGPRIEIEMLALTPALHAKLGPVLGLTYLNPWLRPVR